MKAYRNNEDRTDIGYYSQRREDIIALVPQEVRVVLDVGCGAGVFGDILKRERGIRVYGIERREDMAREARKKLDGVFIGDIEDLQIPLPDGFFDCIIYGDILEHTRDPWRILNSHGRLLHTEGLIVASIPNVGHYRVIKRLIRGQWRYKDSGVMDRTHMRFFTLEGIQELMGGAGYRIEQIHRKTNRSPFMAFLNLILLNQLKDMVTSQYLIVARKTDRTGSPA